MGCLQTTLLQLPLVLQCKQSFLLTLISTAKITFKDGDVTPSNTGLRGREDLLSVVKGDGRTGLEWWAELAGDNCTQFCCSLFSVKKKKRNKTHAGTCESAIVGTCQSSPVLPGGTPFQKGGRYREGLLENPGCWDQNYTAPKRERTRNKQQLIYKDFLFSLEVPILQADQAPHDIVEVLNLAAVLIKSKVMQLIQISSHESLVPTWY